MASIKDIAVYLCQRSQYPDDLSYARITKMIYLADWESAQQKGKQMTNIKWLYNHYGPYVPDVIETIYNDKECFKVTETQNAFGAPKRIVSLKNTKYQPKLTEDKGDEKGERTILDDIIEECDKLSWYQFIDKVYSTYPIREKKRYEYLNLKELAQQKDKKWLGLFRLNTH
ncbi:MAG: SocA family protein [Alphaproteobacteria bacterium GM202ARS2]|nr:SocA family protein [Alphaproteobacteria bacterium GM202ARS2]